MRVTVTPITNFVEGLSEDEREELRDLAVRCFGPPAQRPPHPLTIAPDADTRFVVRVWDEGLLVSCLWITERTILVDGQPVRAAGIRGVRTDPSKRRRGYAGAAMRHAEDFIWRELCPDLAMLHSSVMAVPFYESLGWRAIEGPVTCDQPSGKLEVSTALLQNPFMVIVPTGQELPRGPVDLCGLPW